LKLTEEAAQRVLDAFGPCTELYECFEVVDLIKLAECRDDLKDLIDVEISCEEIRREGAVESAYQQEASGEEHYKGQHQKVIKEWDEALAGIKKRCAEILHNTCPKCCSKKTEVVRKGQTGTLGEVICSECNTYIRQWDAH
jgi:hypothetical protein